MPTVDIVAEYLNRQFPSNRLGALTEIYGKAIEASNGDRELISERIEGAFKNMKLDLKDPSVSVTPQSIVRIMESGIPFFC